MALPFLPGNSFNPNLGKVKYHKSHHFDYNNEVAMNVGETKCGIGGDTLPGQKPRNQNSAIPRGQGSDLPAWVAFDKQVLCFDAYFQEAVHEKREEQFRVRNCKVYFYLEDDSIQVIEPRLKNAGLPQGTLIRRHRIPRPKPYDDTFYTVEDFNVGKEVTMYGRTFKLTDCDQFTRNFLGKLGVKVTVPDQAPEDPYMGHRKALDESMQALRPYEKHDTLKQFLDHDRHVLRFYCYWDDSDNMFGDPRQMVLHYFLADDTIEIREIIPANSGRDAVPMFLNRAKLPKFVEALKQPGVKTDRTVLNVFGPTGHGGRYILDSLKTGAQNIEFYKDSDLSVGTVLNVWGRKFVLTDCDDFTKEYYCRKYGITNFPKVNTSHLDPAQPPIRREVPPYNGFGSEEDSLCSCMGLLPKPPRRDFIKFMEKDRRGLDSNVLRFLATLDTNKPIDADRRFIISYFLADDTILVFEPPVRNSGIVSGKFIERTRIKKPEQERYGTQLSDYYSASDLYVGARVDFNSHKFVLIDADEYAYNYMERHGFPQSNVGRLMSKLAPYVGQFGDPGSVGMVGFDQFRQQLISVTGGQINEHEIRTIARHYQDQQEGGISLDTLVAVAQEQLRKNNFDDFDKVEEHCQHYDKGKTGNLEEDLVRTVFSALHVPLADDLLRALISKVPRDDKGLVPYKYLLCVLNWRVQPVPALPPSQVPNLNDGWQGNQSANQLQRVNMGQFIADLRGQQPPPPPASDKPQC